MTVSSVFDQRPRYRELQRWSKMKSQTPPNELIPWTDLHGKEEPLLKDVSLTPPQSVDMPLVTETNSSGTLTRQVPEESQLGQAIVNLVKPAEPPVTYTEVLKFIWWSLMVIMSQLCKDISSGRIYKPLLRTDFTTHYFVSLICQDRIALTLSSPFQLCEAARASSLRVRMPE